MKNVANVAAAWHAPFNAIVRRAAIVMSRNQQMILGEIFPNGPGAAQLGELVKNEPQASLYLLIRIESDCAVSLASQTCRQKNPQFSALCFMSSSGVQARSDLMEFRFAHNARQTEDQTIVVKTRVIEFLAISDESAEHRAKVKQMIPSAIIAGESRGVQTHDQTDSTKTDFGNQKLESTPMLA